MEVLGIWLVVFAGMVVLVEKINKTACATCHLLFRPLKGGYCEACRKRHARS